MQRIFLLLMVTVFLWACDSKTSEAPIATQATGIPQIDKLLKAVEDEPNNSELFYELSKAYYDNEGFDEAIQSAQRAIALDSTDPNYFHLLSYIYLDYNRSYEALKTIQSASGRFPDSLNTLMNLAEIQMYLKNYEPSIQTIKRILEVNPVSDEAFYLMGMNLKYQGDTANALKSFQTAVDRNENHLLSYQELAILCDELGQDRLSLQYFENSLRINPYDPITLINKANFHRDRRQDNEAILWYKKAFESDKSYPEPNFNIGIIYLEYDSIQRAYNHFNMALETDPAYGIAYYYRGLASKMLGNQSAAIDDYRSALSFNPDMEKAKQALSELGQNFD